LLAEGKVMSAGPYFFLLTLTWLRNYQTELDLATTYGHNEDTLRSYFWFYVQSIQSLQRKKVRFLSLYFIQNQTDPQIQWNPSGDNVVVLMSIDGIHCPISEPHQMPSSKWYSHKYNHPGLTYKLGLRIYDNQPAWINGPFPSGKHDVTIFRKQNGLKSQIPDGKLLIGDQGYAGKGQVVSIRSEFDTARVKAFKRRARARHETFNGLLKEYKILSTRFCSHVSKHKSVFEAICVISQYEIEGPRPLFPV
jgi:hypothetical protein